MKKLRILVFICMVFLCFSLPLSAGGQKEDKLDRARELFEQKKYNEALLLISQVIEEEPEKAEEAVKLSNKIMAIMELFNKKYEELIISLYDEQDVEKGRDIIEEIKEIYPEPNMEIQNSISFAEEGASLVVNLHLFEEIMDTAMEQLNEGEYAGAVETYLSGLRRDPPRDLHRSDYTSASFGTITKTDLDAAYTQLFTAAELFITEAPGIRTKVDEILTTVSFLDQGTDVPSTLEVLDNFIAVREYTQTVRDAGLFIKSQNDKLKERIEAKNTILYLKYTYQLVMGRGSDGETEGILFAMNELVHTLSIGIRDTFVKESETILEQGKTRYRTESYTEAGTLLDRAFDMIQPVLSIAYFLDKGTKPDPDYTVQPIGNWLIDDSLTTYMDVQEQAKEILAYRYFIENLPKTFTFPEISTLLPESMGQYLPLDSSMENQYNELEDDVKAYDDVILTLSNDWESYIRERTEETSSPFDRTRGESIIALCADKASTLIREKLSYLSSMFNYDEKVYQQETALLNQGLEDEEYGVVYYPGERAESFSILRGNLRFITGKLQTIISEWEGEKGTGPGFRQIINNAETLYEKAVGLERNAGEQQEAAEAKILEANKLKNLGDLRGNEARRADRARDYQLAGEKIDEAVAAYNESLGFREDAVVRSRKEQLEELKGEVEEKENRLMISAVRQLIEEGRDYYTRGFYEEAYSTFLRALQRWEEIKEEENAEILDWLAYAQSAYEIESGRKIDETDPLYKEMSQLYNLAKEDYNEGIRLKNEGETREARMKFQEASRKLLPILAQFPHNRDARLLDLYIRKETGEDFEITFREQMEQARSKLRGTRDEKLDAYYDLKDLEEIDPGYRGLKTLITEFEYSLGIKLKPPTAAEKKRSRELTAQAKPYIVNRQFEYFPLAKELLTEALRLDPDNREAKDLFDDMGLLAD